MPSLSSFIEEKKREFWRRFGEDFLEDRDNLSTESIKDFLESSLTELAEKVFKAVRPEEAHQLGVGERGGLMASNIQNIGFNSCRSQVETNYLSFKNGK